MMMMTMVSTIKEWGDTERHSVASVWYPAQPDDDNDDDDDVNDDDDGDDGDDEYDDVRSSQRVGWYRAALCGPSLVSRRTW